MNTRTQLNDLDADSDFAKIYEKSDKVIENITLAIVTMIERQRTSPEINREIKRQLESAKQQLQEKLADAIEFMAEVENATPESDHLLKEKLEVLLTEINGAIALLPK